MWDFVDNQEVAAIAAAIYEAGSIVGAICHGLAALVNLKLSEGEHLIANKTVAAFTNEEEAAVGLTEIVPFLLESKLIECETNFRKVPNFQVGVVASERLVTGQNSASAAGVGHKMVESSKNKYIQKKYHTEKPSFLNNTFTSKSKCSKKVGWVEALVPNAINFKF
jgi:putative intracellular protease/amidase